MQNAGYALFLSLNGILKTSSFLFESLLAASYIVAENFLSQNYFATP